MPGAGTEDDVGIGHNKDYTGTKKTNAVGSVELSGSSVTQLPEAVMRTVRRGTDARRHASQSANETAGVKYTRHGRRKRFFHDLPLNEDSHNSSQHKAASNNALEGASAVSTEQEFKK